MNDDRSKADWWLFLIIVLTGLGLFVTLSVWPPIGQLLLGLVIFALGAFMVFAPESAERLHAKFEWIKTGGRMREPAGWLAMFFGFVHTVIWCIKNFA